MEHISAADLRQWLILGTQPSMCHESGLLKRDTVLHMAKGFRDNNITKRRFNNAADAVNLCDAHRNMIAREMRWIS